MKTLLLAILLLISTTAFSQFQTPLSYEGGIQISNGLDINYYQSTVTLDIQYKFDKFTVASENQTYIIDTLTQFITGIKVGYEVKTWEDNKSLSITGHALADMFGGKPLGVGIQYNTDAVQLSVDYSYVSKYAQNRIGFNIGYLIIK